MTMKIITRVAAFLVTATICSFAFSAALVGKVVGVSDGDTITILDTNKIQHKIRLSGIDAPEKKQAFGERSKQHLSDLVFSKNVTVEWNKTDKYRRTIGKVIVNGVDANLEQIRSGFAWHYKHYQSDQSPTDRSLYSRTETEARERQIGLWRDTKPIPPWEFRHRPGDAAISSGHNHDDSCPCSGQNSCIGKRGGHYCYSESGQRRYIH